MQTIKNSLKHCLFFLVPYGIFIVCAGLALLFFSKEEIHLAFNRHYSGIGDFLMPYITLMADGYTISILVILLIAYNRRMGLWTAAAAVLATAITQVLKNTIYSGEPRPKLFFQNLASLRLVPGVDNYLFDSFPSGHTTVAFAFYFSLVFFVKNNYLKFLFFCFALAVGYSRIYLSQHFLGDVFAGSLIGTISAFVVLTWAIHKEWLFNSQIKR